jgi:hypothetical protein
MHYSFWFKKKLRMFQPKERKSNTTKERERERERKERKFSFCCAFYMHIALISLQFFSSFVFTP